MQSDKEGGCLGLEQQITKSAWVTFPKEGDIHTTLKSHKPETFSEQRNIRKHPICFQILNLELQASLTQSFAYLKQPFNEATSSKHVC